MGNRIMEGMRVHYKVFRYKGKCEEKKPIIESIIVPFYDFTEKKLLDDVCNSIKEEMKAKRYKMKNKGYYLWFYEYPEIKNLKKKINRRLIKNT